ncbi:MAG: OmcA/MtrC family decaheme c-type cytochrome [Thiobacillaceae bacterium]|jgi:OmcA/MtrC family decaheme c-type cytochrome|nr:OmcA/MtrC family decaheme c-type cytochrome [Thiobacillaceae bacterium]
MDNKFLSIMRWGAIALIAGALTACGGDDSDGGGITPPPPPPASTFDGTVQEGGGSIVGVAVNSPPVISFKLQDSAGNPVQPTSLVQFRVALAKYVPGTPERWVPFGVKTATTPDPDKFFYSNENRSCGQTGTGWAFANVKYDAATATYTYYFCTDVTTLPDWDPAATYRIGGEVQYNDAPTGKVRTTNPIADFAVSQGVGSPLEDSTGKDVLARKMLERASCNTCHNDLGQQSKFHGNRRIDPNYCVVCHNDSQFDPATAESLDMRVMVHKFHMGSRLLTSYAPSGLDATKMHFPQDQRNCTKCHTDVAIEGNAYPTPQGGNWKSQPSRAACGSCHDGIDFSLPFGAGNGQTLDPTLPWANSGHVGGVQLDDSSCIQCHTSDLTAGINHMPVTAVSNSVGAVTYYASNDGRLPPGANTVDYEIQSVSTNPSGNPVMVFRILQNGQRLDLRAPSNTSDRAIWPNYDNAPTVYFTYSVPQDGVATPADFNVYVNASLLGIWNGSTTTGTGAGTLTGPDGSGFYTVTLINRVIPANASMLTGALGYAAMLQTNVPGFARTCATPQSGTCTLGLNVTAEDKSQTATGVTARRLTAEADRCNNCHQKLGLFAETTFHSGQRNDPKMCAMCHNPNRTSSGWSADSTAFVHAIHGSSKRVVPYNWHAVVTDAAGNSLSSSTLLTGTEIVSTFAEIGFPGNLNNCLNCHAPGGYNFEGGLAQVPNRLHRVVASGTMAAPNTVGSLSLSTYVTAGAVYGTGYNSSTAAPSGTEGTSLVNSPIANACFGCHDGQTSADPSLSVKAHIESNGGGSIYQTRDTALARQESCLLCHGPTQVVPIKAAHGL